MKTSLTALCFVALLGPVATQSALAQGVEVAEKNVIRNGPPRVVISRPNLIADAVAAFNDRRPEIEAEVKKVLGKGDLIARGVTLYRLNPRIGTASFRFTSQNSFEVNVTDNYLYFRSTTPTDLGSWADPACEVHFDLKLRVQLSLPDERNPRIFVTRSEISVPHITIKGRNVVADVALTFANISDFFVKLYTGRSYIQNAFDKYLRGDVTRETDALLAPINSKLVALAERGYKPSVSINGQMLRITMTGGGLLRNRPPNDKVLQLPDSVVGRPNEPIADKAKSASTRTDSSVLQLPPSAGDKVLRPYKGLGKTRPRRPLFVK